MRPPALHAPKPTKAPKRSELAVAAERRLAQGVTAGISGYTLRHEIVATTSMLAGGRRAVMFRGDGAFTNGDWIVIPDIESSQIYPNEVADVLRGYAVHEAGHLRYTSFAERAKLCELSRALDARDPDAVEELGATIGNIVEDAMIERRLMADYPGLRSLLDRVRCHTVTNRELPGNEDGAWSPGKILLTALIAVANRTNQWSCMEENDRQIEWMRRRFPEGVALTERWEGAIGVVEDTEEAHRLSYEIVLDVVRTFSPDAARNTAPDEAGPSQRTNEKPAESDADGDADDDRHPDPGSDGPEGAKGSQQVAATDQGEAEDPGPDAESGGSQPGAGTDEPGDDVEGRAGHGDGTGRGTGDGEGVGEGEGPGEGSDEAEGGSEDGYGSSSRAESGSDGTRSGDGLDSAVGGATTVTGESGDKPDGNASGEKGGTTSEPDRDGLDESSRSDDGGSEAAPGDGVGRGDGTPGATAPDWTPLRGSETPAEGRRVPSERREAAEGGSDEVGDDAPTRVAPPVIDDLLEDMRGATDLGRLDVSDAAKAAATLTRSQRGLIVDAYGNLPGDPLAKTVVIGHPANGTAGGVRVANPRLARTVRSIVMARPRSRVRRDRDSGEFDHRNIIGQSIGSPTIFKREFRAPDPSMALGVLLDQSISIKAEIGVAAGIASALSEATFTMPRLKSGVWTFTTEDSEGLDPPTTLVLHELKGFTDAPAVARARLAHWQANKGDFGYTPTAEALLEIGARLVARVAERRLVILITDGRPNDEVATLAAHLTLKRMGVRTAAIEIGGHHLPLMALDACAVARTIEDLPAAAAEIARQLLG